MKTDENGKVTIAGKSIRFWVVVFALTILLLTILSFIVQYSFVKLTYQPADGLTTSKLKTQSLQDSGELKDVSTLFGLTLVPRGATQLVTTGEATETYTPLIDLPFIGITDVTIRPQKQRAVEKIGADGLGCEITNRYGDFSYNCSNAKRMLRFNRPEKGPWRVSIYRDSPIDQIGAVRYKDGLLSFHYEAGTLSVEYAEPGTLIKSARVPINSPQDAERDLLLITDKTNKNSSAFGILNRQSGELYYYSELSDTVKPKRFQRKVASNWQFDASLCSMNSTNIYCYFGPITTPSDSKAETNHAKEGIKPTLEVFPIASTSESPSLSTEVTGLPGVDSLYTISDGSLFAYSDEKLYSIRINRQPAAAQLINPQVSGVDNGKSLSFISKDRLYRYDTGTHEMRLVFASSRFRLSNVQVMGDQVLFNSFVNGATDSPSLAHTYLVSDAAVGASRLEDKLPYADNSLPVSFMDYDSTHIYTKLIVGITSDKKTGKMSADPGELQRATYIVTEKLRSDGLLKHNPKLIFDY